MYDFCEYCNLLHLPAEKDSTQQFQFAFTSKEQYDEDYAAVLRVPHGMAGTDERTRARRGDAGVREEMIWKHLKD